MSIYYKSIFYKKISILVLNLLRPKPGYKSGENPVDTETKVNVP